MINKLNKLNDFKKLYFIYSNFGGLFVMKKTIF